MLTWLKELDDLLRGRQTAPAQLAEGRLPLHLRHFVPLAVILGAIYGFFMGWFAIGLHGKEGWMQLVASTVKLPALFLLTLVVTFPSLYVFNALLGCRLSFTATLRLLVGAISVNVAVAASFGPILGFFTVNTTSYPFMVLLNVALLAVAGLVGLSFLLQTLRRLAALPVMGLPPRPPQDAAIEPADGANGLPVVGDAPMPPDPGLLDRYPAEIPDQPLGQARMIFRVWVIIYGLVGMQMGWLLRPFIGNPNIEFTWFRARGGNFFLAVHQQIQNLIHGH